MITKSLDGLWRDRQGYVAAMMLTWNTKIDGADHYRFLANAFNTIPHDIASNGEDDSVLLSKDMFDVLVARKVARTLTDEEAASANKNAEAMDQNLVNAAKETEITAANVEADKRKKAADLTKKAPPVPKAIKVADPLSMTESQLALMAAASAPASSKKG